MQANHYKVLSDHQSINQIFIYSKIPIDRDAMVKLCITIYLSSPPSFPFPPLSLQVHWVNTNTWPYSHQTPTQNYYQPGFSSRLWHLIAISTEANIVNLEHNVGVNRVDIFHRAPNPSIWMYYLPDLDTNRVQFVPCAKLHIFMQWKII